MTAEEVATYIALRAVVEYGLDAFEQEPGKDVDNGGREGIRLVVQSFHEHMPMTPTEELELEGLAWQWVIHFRDEYHEALRSTPAAIDSIQIASEEEL